MWGALPTQLLQASGGLPFMAPIIEAAINSVVSTELQPTTHVQNILSSIAGNKKPRPVLFDPHDLLEEQNKFKEDVERVIAECNIHKHSATCIKPNSPICRLACPRPINPKTSCVQIVSSEKTEQHPHRYEVLDEIDPPQAGSQWDRDLHLFPVAERDERTLVWESKRSLILPPMSTEQQAGKEKGVDFLDLPKDIQLEFDKLPQKTREQVSRTVVERNGSVIEYNDVVSALLACNTDVSLLGSDSQAKLALCYILICLMKSPAPLAKTISLVLNAREKIEIHPSQAKDSGSQQRTAMYFLNKVLNDIVGLVEISAQMAIACLLGMPAETCTHEMKLLFVDAALRYTEEHAADTSKLLFKILKRNGIVRLTTICVFNFKKKNIRQ